tara:strand:- start:187 stop:588 length:402 start_codon:yes stop_codon:yes gene_type:complete
MVMVKKSNIIIIMDYYLGLSAIGIITGLVGGVVGGGSEILIVPLLTLFNLLGSFKTRIGTSLFMLLPPIGLFAAIKFYKNGYVDIFAGLYMALIFTIFSYFSSQLTISLDNNTLKQIFGLFTIIAGIYVVFKN